MFVKICGITTEEDALLDGRPNVSVADVRTMAPPALRHRLVLGYEAVADGVDADQIVAAVLANVDEPNPERAR